MALSHLTIDPPDAFPNDFKSVACSGTAHFDGDVGPVQWILWRNGSVTFTVQDLRSPFTVLTAEHRDRTDNPGCLDPTWIARADAVRAKCTTPMAPKAEPSVLDHKGRR